MKPSFSTDKIGLLYAISAAGLFSFKPILVKLIYVYDVPTLNLLAWRMLLALPIYLLIGLFIWRKQFKTQNKVQHRHNKRPWLIKAIFIGLIGYYLAALFDLQGLQTITTQLERLILFTYPTLVSVFAWLIFKKPITRSTLLALVLSYLGIAIIFISDWQQLGNDIVIGSAWVMLASLSFSLYVVLSKPIIDFMGANEFTVIAMLSSSALALMHFFYSHNLGDLSVPMPVFWLIFTMAILTTVIPSFLLAAAISKIGATQTAVSGTLGPFITSLFAVILLDEYFGWPQAFGLALVVLAISIMQRKPSRSETV